MVLRILIIILQKAILNLRTDLAKDERVLALKICDEILAGFKSTDFDNPNKRGIFNNLDTTMAEQSIEKENVFDNIDSNNNQPDNVDDAPDIDLDDFLK